MKRTLILALVGLALALAPAANAAVSITLGSSDPDALYAPGDMITLTVTVTANGGAAGNTAVGSISYLDSLLNAQAPNVQNGMPGFSGPALDCTTSRCRAMNQITPPGPAVEPNVTDFLISTIRFIVDPTVPLGTVIDFAWQTSPTTQQINFFGLTTAAGYSVTVAAIPEPTTAAMIGMGLFGLAVAGRRRS